MKNFVEELTWRGMIHQMMPGTDELLASGMQTAYLGIDPTADSLHIGHLCGVMMLRHFQRCGHKPLALIGGATGMIGDPSGKSQERNLLDEETLKHNVACIKAQLSHFLDFESDEPNKAELPTSTCISRAITSVSSTTAAFASPTSTSPAVCPFLPIYACVARSRSSMWAARSMSSRVHI